MVSVKYKKDEVGVIMCGKRFETEKGRNVYDSMRERFQGGKNMGQNLGGVKLASLCPPHHYFSLSFLLAFCMGVNTANSGISTKFLAFDFWIN